MNVMNQEVMTTFGTAAVSGMVVSRPSVVLTGTTRDDQFFCPGMDVPLTCCNNTNGWISMGTTACENSKMNFDSEHFFEYRTMLCT